MKLKIEQKEKDLYSASFDIKDEKENIVGFITFKGNLGSMEGKTEINYNQTINMSYTSKKNAIDIAGEYIDYSFFRKPFRPYLIKTNDQEGIIFNFQKKNMSYDFLRINNNNYYMYVLGFGEKGMCCPIYKDDTPIGEITKDCVVQDDKHIFNIDVKESSDSLVSIIECVYLYIFSYYKAGQKLISGITKDVYITKNKEMLEKCVNPDFFKK